MTDRTPPMTHATGMPVVDNTNIQTARPQQDADRRNLGATPTYWRNSKGAWMDRNEALIEPPLPIEGDATWWDHRVDDDHYEQPGNLFRTMSPRQQQLLFENTARFLGDARLEVKQRHIANCTKADSAYGAGVAAALGLTVDQAAE